MTTKKTVLLVEDDETVSQTLSELLYRSNFDVVSACNGVDALLKFMEAHERIDLVVTDIMMPRANGFAFSEELKKMSPNVAVIGISGCLSRDSTPTIDEVRDADGETIKKFHLDHFLEKPFSLETFQKAINKFMPA